MAALKIQLDTLKRDTEKENSESNLQLANLDDTSKDIRLEMSNLRAQLSATIREAERMQEERVNAFGELAKWKKQIHELQEEIKSLKGTGVRSPLARAIEEVIAQEPDPLARQIFFKIVQNGKVIDMPSHDL